MNQELKDIIKKWKFCEKIHGSEEYCILLQLQILFDLMDNSNDSLESINLTHSFG